MKTLGIDIGGTKINAVLWEKDVLDTRLISTPKTKKSFLKELEILISGFQIHKFSSIAVGFAGLLDENRHIVLHAPNLKFLQTLDLHSYFSGFSSHVGIWNDADCAAVAEYKLGVLQGTRNSVLLALGTGIGSGIIIDGKLYVGKGWAGEIGHTIIHDSKTAEDMIGGKHITDFSIKGYKPVVHYAAQLIGNAINILNPDAVALSGGVALKAPKGFLTQLQKETKKYIVVPTAKNTPIICAQTGVNAVSIGACLLLADQLRAAKTKA